MNLIVWGVGQEYAKNKNEICNLTYRLIDASEEKQGLIFDGIRVESPDILFDCQYDCVMISTNLYYNEIYSRLLNQYCVPSRKILRLEKNVGKELLMREIGKYELKKCNGPKILFGYCFLIYENCRIHDYLLAESLRLRGAEIIPVACGGVQECQCSFYGGLWGNNTHDVDEKRINHSRNCKTCREFDEMVWIRWGNYNVTFCENYLTEEDRQFARNFVQKLDMNLIEEWTYDEFPIGKWSLDVYYNMELISQKNSWTLSEEKEIKDYAYNVVIMCIVSLKMVEDIRPDIIYSNDSYYYPFAVLEMVAKKKNIPFYNAYGFRKDSYTYAMNASTVSMKNLNSAWQTFSKQILNNEQEQYISNYILNRKNGAGMLLNVADPFQSARQIRSEAIYGVIDNKKKTALLATNVTWDASALDKKIVFQNTVEWVLYTINWFVNNNEWQLIVRSHPAEVAKLVPEARERICSIILEHYHNKLPSNIVLVDADAPVSIYDLYSIADLGLVYTSTAGLEMCCNGIPIIVVADAPYRGKGFTYDPVNVGEYEKALENLVKTPLRDEESKLISRQAKKFFLLYYFIYMLPNYFYKFTYEEGAKMFITTPEELMPGKNRIWDYICDSILEGKAIISEDRIPPYELVNI